MMLKLMENAFANEKIEITHFTTPQGKTLSQVLIMTPSPREIYHSPRKRRRNMETYFKMYCLKSAFLKIITEGCTFILKVLLVTLSKKLSGYNF